MSTESYTVATAIADLAEHHLIESLLVGEGGRWRAKSPAEAAGCDTAFLGAAIDTRAVEAGQLYVALEGDRVDGRDFIGRAFAAGSMVALTRSWDGPRADPLLTTEAVDGAVIMLSRAPRSAFAHLAGCWRWRRAVTLIAVTGTNGKTTTKDFLAALLSGAGRTLATAANLNNELGVPLTLLALRDSHRFAVVEMGASAVGDIARLGALARPRIGVITNAAEAHLAHFGTLDDVVRGKGEMLDVLPDNGVAVLNADSPGYRRWRQRAGCAIVSWGHDDGDHRWSWRPGAGDRGLLSLDGAEWRVPLPGRHNAANLAAAVVAASSLGVARTEMEEGLKNFTPSPHRSRLVDLGGIRVLDDAYNANPTSMRAAVAALCALPGRGRNIAALGVMGELGDRSDELHRGLGSELVGRGLDLLLAVGESAAPLAEGFAAAGGSTLCFDRRVEAAEWLADNTMPGDRLLIKASRSAGLEEILRTLRRLIEEVDPETGS